jgi:hypothetical protein
LALAKKASEGPLLEKSKKKALGQIAFVPLVNSANLIIKGAHLAGSVLLFWPANREKKGLFRERPSFWHAKCISKKAVDARDRIGIPRTAGLVLITAAFPHK